MMRDSIGDYLKTERETRRLSIEEVSSTTRIPPQDARIARG